MNAGSMEAVQPAASPPGPGLEILLVDDEPAIAEALGEALRDEGHRVTVAFDGAEAMNRLNARVFDVVISDVRLPEVDGLTIFRRLRREAPATQVILISAYATVPDAVEVIKQNAANYLAKPFDLDELLRSVEQVAEQRRLEAQLARARAQLADAGPATPIVGEAPPIVLLRQRIAAIADTDCAVLITGESGTGKDLVARNLHERSSRRDGPFVAVNCAAFPDTLLEAELFGHERGAFTGAARRRDGRLKAAHRGTLFLDELVELSPAAQAKLLRVLEEGVFTPLGTNTSVQVDVRVLSATNGDLKQLVQQGRFREDLFYRVKVFHIDVPPLRERRADLPLLMEFFCHRYNGAGTPRLSPRAWAAFANHTWPGNVRELQHALKHALVLAAGGEIQLEHLPDEIRGGAGDRPSDTGALRPLADAVREFEREYLLRALRVTGGSRGQAAKLLGISRKALWAKLRRYGVRDEDVRD
jgi:DNA-binding NtrC family response regulator